MLNEALHCRLKASIEELEAKLLDATQILMQEDAVPEVTARNVNEIIAAINVEVEKLFDDSEKAKQALKMLTELTKDPEESDDVQGGGNGGTKGADHSHLDFASHEELWKDQSAHYRTLLEEERKKVEGNSGNGSQGNGRLVQLLLGKALNEQGAGNHEEVLRDAVEILTLQPNVESQIQALIMQGKAHKALGKRDLAKESLLRAKKLAESDEDRHHLDEVTHELKHLHDAPLPVSDRESINRSLS